MNKFLKLFYVQDISDAPKMAAGLFSCSESEVFVSVLEELYAADGEIEETAPDWLVFTAFIGEGGENPAFIDADMNMFFEPDGVYLETYPFFGGGIPLKVDEAVEYIERKAINAVDIESARRLIQSNSGGRMKIAPEQEETVLSEDILAWYSKDEMEGYMRFLPPDAGGEKLTVMKISEKLRQAGIIYGVSPMSLGEANREKKYGKQYTVAKGTMPEDGVNGELIYHFEKNREAGRPKEDERGRVNYRDLNLFENVKKGQLLITRTLATQGKSGSTVTGTELLPKAGREVNMPRTKNVLINADMTTARAEFGGMIEVVNGIVNVSNKYIVKGNCDLSTGNIEFDGTIVISGAVISGMLVRASGDITVGGVVNEAELISGGNIDLKLGIQGNDKAKVTATGNVTAAFIERAEVRAKGDIISDVIMHSNIETAGRVFARGKRGNIVGGRVLAGEMVEAKTIGAPSHVQTDIQVGLLPEKKARVKFLREELKTLEKDESKIAQIELYLSRAENISQERKNELTEQVKHTRAQTEKSQSEYSKELAGLLEEAAHLTNGEIHCGVIVYPGTRISIGTSVYRVESETRAATFKNNGGEIVFGPCEHTI